MTVVVAWPGRALPLDPQGRVGHLGDGQAHGAGGAGEGEVVVEHDGPALHREPGGAAALEVRAGVVAVEAAARTTGNPSHVAVSDRGPCSTEVGRPPAV